MRTIDPVTGQVLNVTFAEPETLTKIRAARARVTAARADLEKAARKLSLVHRNSDALELQGKNPADEVTAARQNIEAAKRGVSKSKSDFTQLVLDEREDFETVRDSVLNSIRAGQIEPAVREFRALVANLESAINALIEKIEEAGGPSVDLSTAEAFDAKIAAWNDFVRATGAPGNALVDPSNSARLSVLNQILAAVKEFTHVDCAVGRIRQAVGIAQREVAKTAR